MKNVKAILKQKQIGVSYSSKSETVFFKVVLPLLYWGGVSDLYSGVERESGNYPNIKHL